MATPTVTVGDGVIGAVTLPSFSSNPNETVTIQGPTSGSTQGVIMSLSSSNQAVVQISAAQQANVQTSPQTTWTFPISGPGVTTILYTYIDAQQQLHTGTLYVAVAP
jgi:hypothetical protein